MVCAALFATLALVAVVSGDSCAENDASFLSADADDTTLLSTHMDDDSTLLVFDVSSDDTHLLALSDLNRQLKQERDREADADKAFPMELPALYGNAGMQDDALLADDEQEQKDVEKVAEGASAESKPAAGPGFIGRIVGGIEGVGEAVRFVSYDLPKAAVGGAVGAGKSIIYAIGGVNKTPAASEEREPNNTERMMTEVFVEKAAEEAEVSSVEVEAMVKKAEGSSVEEATAEEAEASSVEEATATEAEVSSVEEATAKAADASLARAEGEMAADQAKFEEAQEAAKLEAEEKQEVAKPAEEEKTAAFEEASPVALVSHLTAFLGGGGSEGARAVEEEVKPPGQWKSGTLLEFSQKAGGWQNEAFPQEGPFFSS